MSSPSPSRTPYVYSYISILIIINVSAGGRTCIIVYICVCQKRGIFRRQSLCRILSMIPSMLDSETTFKCHWNKFLNDRNIVPSSHSMSREFRSAIDGIFFFAMIKIVIRAWIAMTFECCLTIMFIVVVAAMSHC